MEIKHAEFTAEKARQCYGGINYILHNISIASESHRHAYFCKGYLRIEQKKRLIDQGYEIKDLGWFNRIFKKRYHKITW